MGSVDKSLDDRVKDFETRMEEKKEKEKTQEEAEAEKLRQDYLQRTGRTELKP